MTLFASRADLFRSCGRPTGIGIYHVPGTVLGAGDGSEHSKGSSYPLGVHIMGEMRIINPS